MQLEFDPDKRNKTLAERGLDFARVGEVFACVHITSADPDDAPELTDDFFVQGVWQLGEKPITKEEGTLAMRKALGRGRPKAASTKQALTVRYDAEVVAAFKSSGKGWQSRMNAALREWLQTHSAA